MDAASRKAEIVARMQAQRDAWQARRAAPHAELQPPELAEGDQAGEAQAASPNPGALAALTDNQIVRTVVAHPLAAAGVVGLLLMLGPRKLLRLSAWVLPLVLRR